ncbi:MAG: hypothetical protein A2Z16_01955 [Chloroflexi bacterium RBG_16_54_18]|nr:MAG: hypothetical protein A2Z16_01955 [Chloroflexi bacterium RBG_16_54_18]
MTEKPTYGVSETVGSGGWTVSVAVSEGGKLDVGVSVAEGIEVLVGVKVGEAGKVGEDVLVGVRVPLAVSVGVRVGSSVVEEAVTEGGAVKLGMRVRVGSWV